MVKEPGEGKRVGDFTWTPLAVTLCLRMFSLDKSSISSLLSVLPWATLFTLPVPVTQVPMKTSELLLPISQTCLQSDACSSVSGKEGRGSFIPHSLPWNLKLPGKEIYLE